MRQRTLLILSVLALLIASCGNKGGKSGLLVPKDAAIVIHINSSSLSSKISWDEIRQTNWFKEMSKDATDTLSQQLLANPTSSGIDMKDDFVFYMEKQGQGGYLVFQGSLTDAAAYEKLLMKMNEKEPKEIKKDGEFSYMGTGKGSLLIWNKLMFTLVANANIPGTKTPFGNNRESYEEKHEFQEDSLKIFGKDALTLKNSNNLDGDSRFASLVKDGSDVHLWMNLAQYYTGMGPMLSMMKVSVLLKDNVSATSINFDNGKIAAKSKQYYGEEMSKVFSKNKAENVSADVINRIPSQNVAAVFAFNYPPKGLQEFLKVIGLDGMANGYLSQMDYSVEEFIKGNKGEVLIAISDLGLKTRTDSLINKAKDEDHPRMSMIPDMNLLFATSVKDKAAFEKLVTLVWQSSKGMTEKMPEISYKLENDWFAVSNSSEQTNKFLAGGNTKLPFTDKITGHPMGVYIDLQKIIQLTGSFFGTDSSGKAGIDVSLNMWEDIVATGGEYNNKALEFEFSVNLVDKNTNSLKQLSQYFEKLSALRGKRLKDLHTSHEHEDGPSAETAPLAPPSEK